MAVIDNTRATPRVDLGVAMEEYPLAREAQGFVGLEILPILPQQKRAASIPVITRESILRARNTKRAARGGYSRDEYNTNEVSYECEENGHEQAIDDTERENHASDWDSDMLAAAMAQLVVLRAQERRIAAAIFNTTTWTGASLYTDVSTDWDDVSATIIANVEAARQKIRALTGLLPDTMVINAAKTTNFSLNTQIKDTAKFTMPITPAVLAGYLPELFQIPRIIFAGAVKNTADEGQDLTSGDIWSGLYCWLGVTARTQSLQEAAVGRTILWDLDSPSNLVFESYREEQTRSDIVRARQFTDEVIFDASFGHLLKIDT